MENPIIINSDNIEQFGFSATFKLGQTNKITFDINGITVFNDDGDIESIVVRVIDNFGVQLGSASVTGPDYDAVDIALPSNISFGIYTVEGIIKDSDGQEYRAYANINLCQPNGWKNGSVKGDFKIDVDCEVPSIRIAEVTPFSYLGKAPITLVTDGAISYPDRIIEKIEFAFSPFIIGGADGIYTGIYSLNSVTKATYDIGYNIFVEIPYRTRKDFSVECTTGLAEILCCIEEAYEKNSAYAFTGKGENYKEKLAQISGDLLLAMVKEKTGKDATEEISRIKKVLNCDCGCSSSTPTRLTGAGGAALVNVVGSHAVTVTPSSAGGTTTYTVESKLVSLTKSAGDLAFSIGKSTSSGGINYNISFNYDVLSNTILQAIKSDEDLTILFNSIVKAAGYSVNLDALNGKCVLDFSSCNYSLVEPTVPIKTVVKITIGGTEYEAPSDLLLTQAGLLEDFLNSLEKGDFSVSYDGSLGKTTILSESNSNKITSITFSTDSGTKIRQFSKSCGTIEAVFQAVIDYLCAIDANQIKLKEEMSLCLLQGDGTVSRQKYTTNQSVQVYLNAITAAICTLTEKISKATAIDCSTIKGIYKSNQNPIKEADVIHGTKDGECSVISYGQFITKLLSTINESQVLKDAFCEIASSCTIPVCEPPTNVSADICFGSDCSPIEEIEGE